jgi:hypothetical protein
MSSLVFFRKEICLIDREVIGLFLARLYVKHEFEEASQRV